MGLLCLPSEPGEVRRALCGTVDRRSGAPHGLDQRLRPERTAQRHHANENIRRGCPGATLRDPDSLHHACGGAERGGYPVSRIGTSGIPLLTLRKVPTVFTHAIAGAAIAQVLAPAKHLRAATLLAAGAAVLPDIDALGFWLGVHGGLIGHRGITHSLLFAGIVAAGLPLLFPRGADRWRVAACILAGIASHGLLDALTNGGSGVAFFAPFSDTRYFFPVTPIRVAPIRPAALFTKRGAAVLQSELLWVWIPAGVMAWAARTSRAARGRL